MAMEGVITGKVVGPRRVVLYGVHGIGKSTFGASAPAPIFVQAEKGIEDIGAARFPVSRTFEDLIGRYKQVSEEEHEFSSLVTDSLDGVERLIHAEVCKEEGKQYIDEIGYGRGFKSALKHWQKVLSCLEYIQVTRGMNILLLGHSQVEKFEDPQEANYDRWTLQLNKHATALVAQWADEVLFATYKTYIKTSDEGFNKKKARGIGSGERILKTTERPSHVAKNRLTLPDELPLPRENGWSVLAPYMNGAKSIKKEEATSGKP